MLMHVCINFKLCMFIALTILTNSRQDETLEIRGSNKLSQTNKRHHFSIRHMRVASGIEEGVRGHILELRA